LNQIICPRDPFRNQGVVFQEVFFHSKSFQCHNHSDTPTFRDSHKKWSGKQNAVPKTGIQAHHDGMASAHYALKASQKCNPPVWLGWAEKLGLAGSGLDRGGGRVGGGGGLGWITLKKKYLTCLIPTMAQKSAPPLFV
jgi:hypothetical protein